MDDAAKLISAIASLAWPAVLAVLLYKLFGPIRSLVDKSRWGEGLATEAATAIARHAGSVLKIQRLICLIMPGNAASIRVAEKAGMAFERELVDEHGACHLYSCRLSPGARLA